jgi:hypothetical protein
MSSPFQQRFSAKSPLNQRKKETSLNEKEYTQDLRREKRMPGFAEKPVGGIQKEAASNRKEALESISKPKSSALLKREDRKSKKVAKKINKAIEIDRKTEYKEDGELTNKGKRLEKKSDRKKASAKKTYDKLSDEGKEKARNKTIEKRNKNK